jgi:solute carrier family 25 (adenine nucleotide translocator) protein 4/5/6/31
MQKQEHLSLTQLSTKAISTCASVAVSHSIHAPLKRVGIILITQHANPQVNTTNIYSSGLDVLKRVPKEQGILSFWRGNVPAILRAIPTLAINFVLRDYFRIYMNVDEKSGAKHFLSGMLAGGMAGAASLFVTYPLQIARTRMAADIGIDKTSREYTKFTTCIRDIYSNSGIPGLYRGFTLSVIGLFFYRGMIRYIYVNLLSALYFGIYDGCKPYIRKHYGDSFVYSYMAGWIATFAATGLLYPVDAVRFRLMMQTGRNNEQYFNARQCIRNIYATEGMKGFYRGAGYNTVFLSFSGAALLALYDKFQVIIKKI